MLRHHRGGDVARRSVEAISFFQMSASQEYVGSVVYARPHAPPPRTATVGNRRSQRWRLQLFVIRWRYCAVRVALAGMFMWMKDGAQGMEDYLGACDSQSSTANSGPGKTRSTC